jgi:hypothetical protein
LFVCLLVCVVVVVVANPTPHRVCFRSCQIRTAITHTRAQKHTEQSEHNTGGTGRHATIQQHGYILTTLEEAASTIFAQVCVRAGFLLPLLLCVALSGRRRLFMRALVGLSKICCCVLVYVQTPLKELRAELLMLLAVLGGTLNTVALLFVAAAAAAA